MPLVLTEELIYSFTSTSAGRRAGVESLAYMIARERIASKKLLRYLIAVSYLIPTTIVFMDCLIRSIFLTL
jgi:hypothetical protein